MLLPVPHISRPLWNLKSTNAFCTLAFLFSGIDILLEIFEISLEGQLLLYKVDIHLYLFTYLLLLAGGVQSFFVYFRVFIEDYSFIHRLFRGN